MKSNNGVAGRVERNQINTAIFSNPSLLLD